MEFFHCVRERKKEEREGGKRKKKGEEEGRRGEEKERWDECETKRENGPKKWRGCGHAPLLVTEFFSVAREGEASKRRRSKKKKIKKGRKERRRR